MSSTSLQRVSEQTIDGNIDIDRSFELYVNRSFQRNPDLAKKINFVYRFDIKRKSNPISTWILDLTQGSGALHRDVRDGIKCVVTLDESDLMQAMVDKSHWFKMFSERRMGLKGTRVALEKLQQFWVESDKCNQDFQLIYKQSDHKSSENKPNLESIVCNGFKSDIIFHTLRNRMHEEVDIVRQLHGVMQFNINQNDRQSVWTIDFTQPLGHNVYPGPPKDKPICILSMEDEDFAKMMVNKFNPQKAFMMGKMKVKGQILAIYKLFTVWIDAAFRKKKAPEVSYIEDILLKNDLIPGLKSEIIVFRLIQKFVKTPNLCEEVDDVLYFDITKEGKVVSKWKLDVKSGKPCAVFSRQPIDVESPTKSLIMIADEDFVQMAGNQLDIQSSLASNRIKGDISLAPKLSKIFQNSIIRSKL